MPFQVEYTCNLIAAVVFSGIIRICKKVHGLWRYQVLCAKLVRYIHMESYGSLSTYSSYVAVGTRWIFQTEWFYYDEVCMV